MDEKSRAKRARVRARWTPPSGPPPTGDGGDPALRPGPDETLDALSGDWRIFQRRDGHRYSTDDFLTAAFALDVAARVGLRPSRCLDLGAGIGSVAFLVAWSLPRARVTGIEAQTLSAALFARSIRWNGAQARVDVRPGDLRDVEAHGDLRGACDLVTGSPPYIPHGRGTPSARPQCDPCRFERRGGVEDYCRAAAFALTEDGVFALVHEDRAAERVRTAGLAAGLAPLARRTVVFRVGRAPLIALYAFGRPGRAELPEGPPLVIRERDGGRGAEYRELRARMGFPP